MLEIVKQMALHTMKLQNQAITCLEQINANEEILAYNRGILSGYEGIFNSIASLEAKVNGKNTYEEIYYNLDKQEYEIRTTEAS